MSSNPSNHPDPEWCAASREGRREAFTGETTGQVLSRETGLIPTSGRGEILVPTATIRARYQRLDHETALVRERRKAMLTTELREKAPRQYHGSEMLHCHLEWLRTDWCLSGVATFARPSSHDAVRARSALGPSLC